MIECVSRNISLAEAALARDLSARRWTGVTLKRPAAVEGFLIAPSTSIRDAMAVIDRNGEGIALVVDADRRLIGTVTDGDVRRVILAGIDLDGAVGALVEHKADLIRSVPATPVVASPGMAPAELLQRMTASGVRQLPVVDDEGRVVDVVLFGDLIGDAQAPLSAVVMAGGSGTRLRPLTADTPKPMLPVGGRPLLEHIIDQLRTAGISSVNLTTHYRAEQIVDHFGDGSRFGVDIQYVTEDRPLGTAGSLSAIEADGPLVVMNGDILTAVDFRALSRFHLEHQADMTVGVRVHELRLPFGVVETNGVEVERITEKPAVRHLVNAGIYVLSPAARAAVTPGEPQSMVDLIERLLADGRRVIAFPIHEDWLDIGDPSAYEEAQERVRSSE